MKIDLIRSILRDKKKFAQRIYQSNIDNQAKKALLQLATNEPHQVVEHIINSWIYNIYGVGFKEPLLIPPPFLPPKDHEKFWEYIRGILREVI